MSEQKRADGKTHKKRKIKHKPVLEQVPQPAKGAAAAAEDGNSKFARALGSTDYGTREKGLQALSRWLVHKDSMQELDMMKLWKGLFFCFWHSDKVPVQTDLAERLAGLLTQLQPGMAQLYWAGLLATLRREWFAMDHHRLNKFLMLVRKFVAALFTRLAAANWDVSAINSLVGQLPLGQAPLIPPTANKSLGFSYHLADVWLQELRQVAGEQAVPAEALLLLLEPFVVVMEAGSEQALLARVKESVFDVLASDLAAAAAAAGEEDAEQQSLYCQQLDVQQLAEQLFSRGAAEGVKARNRQALYNASKDLERVAGKRRKKAAAAAATAAAAAADAGAAAEQQQQQVKEKKGHKKHKHAEQQLEQQLQQQQAPEQTVDATPGKKQKRLHKQEQQQQQQSDQQQLHQQPVANGVTPSSSKKRARGQQAAAAAEAAAATPVTPTAAAAGADAATPQPSMAHKSGKKKKRHSTDADAAEDADAPSTAKKGVKINLKKNVYFAHGAPVPPPDVRSPPATKPKGSALKVKAGTPATAPAKQQHGSRLGPRKAVTPNSVPRVKAAAFF